jgi:hypothetical protein
VSRNHGVTVDGWAVLRWTLDLSLAKRVGRDIFGHISARHRHPCIDIGVAHEVLVRIIANQASMRWEVIKTNNTALEVRGDRFTGSNCGFYAGGLPARMKTARRTGQRRLKFRGNCYCELIPTWIFDESNFCSRIGWGLCYWCLWTGEGTHCHCWTLLQQVFRSVCVLCHSKSTIVHIVYNCTYVRSIAGPARHCHSLLRFL